MSIDYKSEFSIYIREAIELVRPQRLIETGTYIGLGTTLIMASALKDAGLTESIFYSIEVNPHYYHQALVNLDSYGFANLVRLVNGLSIFRKQLPSKEELHQDLVEFTGKKWPDGIFIDHSSEERVEKYFWETNHPGPEGVLLDCLSKFEYKPDFVLLDSGGHIGDIEFDMLISSVKGPCTIALDDTYHIKHYNSFRKIIRDSRFKIFKISKEKFGFCIVFFNPGESN